MRRDLHDGLGPTLSSQTLKPDAAIELLDDEKRETRKAREILRDLKTQPQNTVADIRRIVYELRPPVLDDSLRIGIVGAGNGLSENFRARVGIALMRECA